MVRNVALFPNLKNYKETWRAKKIKKKKKQLENEKNCKFKKKKSCLPGVYLLQPENIE